MIPSLQRSRSLIARLGPVFLCYLLSITAGMNADAQLPPPLSFFPHHDGDIWEYVDPFNPSDFYQNTITSDTIDSDGNYHVKTSRFGTNTIDAISFEVWRTYRPTDSRGAVDSLLWYKLDADSGETWVVFNYGPGVTQQATVVAEFQTYVFGSLVTMKVVNYVDSASGILTTTDYLASDFGLVGQDNDATPISRIRGAIIDSVQYGVITASAYSQYQPIPDAFVLYQNYPNPFNPSTTIRYTVPQRSHVTLKVYNMLGQEIATLVDEQQDAGSHKVEFKPTGLASSTYFYRLEAGGHIEVKKLVLMK